MSWPGLDFANLISSRTEAAGTDGGTIRIFGTFATRAQGAQSLIASYGIFSTMLGLTVRMREYTMNNVYPSGADLASASPAIIPLAPPRLSTTTVCPHRLASPSPK